MVHHDGRGNIQSLSDNINFGDIKLRRHFINFAGILSCKKIFKQLYCSQHTLASEKEKGEIEERESKNPAQPWGNVETGGSFFFPSLNTDDS